MLTKISKVALFFFLNQLSSYILFFSYFKVLDSNSFAQIIFIEGAVALLTVINTFQFERGSQRLFFRDGNKLIFYTPIISALLFYFFALLVFFLLEKLSIKLFTFENINLILTLSILSSINSIINLYLQSSKKYNLLVLSSIAKNLPILLFSYFIILLNIDNYIYYFYILIISNFTAILSSNFFKLNEINKNILYANFIKISKYSLPFLPTVFFSWIINFGGRYFFESEIYSESLSDYAYWYKFCTAYIFFTAIVNILFSPNVMNLFEQGSVSSINLYKKHLFYFFLFSSLLFYCLISLVNSLFLNKVLNFWVVAIMISIHCISSFMGSYTDLLINHMYKSKIQAISYGFASFVSIVICYISYPFIGINALLVSNTVAILIIFLFHAYVNKLIFNIKYYFIILFFVILFLLLLYLLFIINSYFLLLFFSIISIYFLYYNYNKFKLILLL